MKSYSSTKYSLSPTIIFVIIGFILLFSVILLHDYINQSEWVSLPVLAAGQTTKTGVPDQIVNEITRSEKNISGYPEYLKNASFAMKKVYELNHPQIFITQE